MRPVILIPSTLLGLLSACEEGRLPTVTPPFVYVPTVEPTVVLSVRASAREVEPGEPVILHAERRAGGEWKRVPSGGLTPDQCWMARPPARYQPEVADNLRWEVEPAGAARFNTGYRADHTREVVFTVPGTYTLRSASAIWCRPDEVARGEAITVVVRDGAADRARR